MFSSDFVCAFIVIVVMMPATTSDEVTVSQFERHMAPQYAASIESG